MRFEAVEHVVALSVSLKTPPVPVVTRVQTPQTFFYSANELLNIESASC